MYLASIGYGNTALGESALYQHSGSNNVGIGQNALKLATEGFGNTGIGNFVLYKISGSYNTALGWSAGAYASGSGNLYLGASAGSATDVIENSKLYIASGSGTPLIGGDFASGSVTINNILTLAPRATTPATAETGSIMISGSGIDCKMYVYLGRGMAGNGWAAINAT
jgi:hypothetical protein